MWSFTSGSCQPTLEWTDMAVVHALGPRDTAEGCEHLRLDDKRDVEALSDVVRAEREAWVDFQPHAPGNWDERAPAPAQQSMSHAESPAVDFDL